MRNDDGNPDAAPLAALLVGLHDVEDVNAPHGLGWIKLGLKQQRINTGARRRDPKGVLGLLVPAE
jgi:hypothetical protein